MFLNMYELQKVTKSPLVNPSEAPELQKLFQKYRFTLSNPVQVNRAKNFNFCF